MEPAELPDSGPAGVSGRAGATAGTIFGAGCACCRNSSAAANLPGCRGPVRLLNTSVCPITQQQSVAIVLDSLKRGQGGWIVTPNLDHVRRCARDPHYAKTVLNASLRLADGMPLVWASRLQRTPVPERVPGSDLIYSLSRALAAEGRSIYLLGGEPGTAEAAAQVLGNLNPGLRIAGTCCPPLGFEQQPEELRSIRSRLVAAKPDLVFVALGSPKQEYLIQSLRLLLPTTWWVGVGISFSFVCGQVKRAPKWIQRCGLEWIHRLVQEPRRLAKRYVFYGIPFAIYLLIHAAVRKGMQRPLPAEGDRSGPIREAAEA